MNLKFMFGFKPTILNKLVSFKNLSGDFYLQKNVNVSKNLLIL